MFQPRFKMRAPVFEQLARDSMGDDFGSVQIFTTDRKIKMRNNDFDQNAKKQLMDFFLFHQHYFLSLPLFPFLHSSSKLSFCSLFCPHS